MFLDASRGFLNGAIEKSVYAYPNAENAEEQGVDSGSDSSAKAERKCQERDKRQSWQAMFYDLPRQISIADKLTFSDAVFGFLYCPGVTKRSLPYARMDSSWCIIEHG
jgi:hypothetical protein